MNSVPKFNLLIKFSSDKKVDGAFAPSTILHIKTSWYEMGTCFVGSFNNLHSHHHLTCCTSSGQNLPGWFCFQVLPFVVQMLVAGLSVFAAG